MLIEIILKENTRLTIFLHQNDIYGMKSFKEWCNENTVSIPVNRSIGQGKAQDVYGFFADQLADRVTRFQKNLQNLANPMLDNPDVVEDRLQKVLTFLDTEIFDKVAKEHGSKPGQYGNPYAGRHAFVEK